MKKLQNKIDFLQNEVALKEIIIKMLLEMETGNLDSDTNRTSPDKDKITSINITDDSFVLVKDISQNGNQTTYTNRDISEKKQLFIRNLHSDTTEEDLCKLFCLRATQ